MKLNWLAKLSWVNSETVWESLVHVQPSLEKAIVLDVNVRVRCDFKWGPHIEEFRNSNAVVFLWDLVKKLAISWEKSWQRTEAADRGEVSDGATAWLELFIMRAVVVNTATMKKIIGLVGGYLRENMRKITQHRRLFSFFDLITKKIWARSLLQFGPLLIIKLSTKWWHCPYLL